MPPRPHPGRKHLLIGGTLFFLALTTAALFFASRYRCITARGTLWHAWVAQGTFEYISLPVNSIAKLSPGLNLSHLNADVQHIVWTAGEREQYLPTTDGWKYAIIWNWRWQGYWNVGFCLWPIPLLLTVAAVPFVFKGLKARGRARRGCCPYCSYDKHTLPPNAPCPECGK